MPHPLDPDWYKIDRCAKHIVSVGWFRGQVKGCMVQFHRAGIFVHFPYHPDVPGVVSRCDVGPGPKQTDVNLIPGGAVTSHKVKYSHHVDGNAHFSQDGKIRTAVRGRAASLRENAGHIFSIDIQGLQSLSKFTSDEYYSGKYGRAYFELQDSDPQPVHIVARWVMIPPGIDLEHANNPVSIMGGDTIVPYLALAPSPGSPLENGLLLVNVTTREPMNDEEFSLVFTGGFAKGLSDPDTESSLLVMEYPATDIEAFPSIDLEASSSED